MCLAASIMCSALATAGSIGRGVRQPRDPGDHLEGTVAGGLHLSGRPQPTTALVQLGAYPLPPLLDAIFIDRCDTVFFGHVDAIRVFAPRRNPPESIRHAHRLRFTWS